MYIYKIIYKMYICKMMCIYIYKITVVGGGVGNVSHEEALEENENALPFAR